MKEFFEQKKQELQNS